MDDIVKAEMINVRDLTARRNGATACLTTGRGDVYHVWLDFDGQPMIEKQTTR